MPDITQMHQARTCICMSSGVHQAVYHVSHTHVHVSGPDVDGYAVSEDIWRTKRNQAKLHKVRACYLPGREASCTPDTITGPLVAVKVTSGCQLGVTGASCLVLRQCYLSAAALEHSPPLTANHVTAVLCRVETQPSVMSAVI